MQDPNMNINSARLDDLVHAIAEARRSLQNWQDKRTEAMIRLDAFAYDVQKIEEDRARMDQKISDLKHETQSQAKIYQSHVGELTDQMQLLKLESENLRNEILDKNMVIESLHKEIEAQKVLRGQLVHQHAQKQNELRAELEVKFANQIWDLKMKNESLASQLLDSSERCASSETQVEKLERELAQIRSHMMGILQAAPSGAGAEAHPRRASTTSGAQAMELSKKAEFETQTIQSVSGAGASAESASHSAAPTVDDYLKRLGY
jgi:chromosome segregation ATPase